MPKDPIIEEIHQIREKLIEEHGGLDGFFEHLQQVQKELGDRVVRRAPKPPAANTRKIS